MGKKLGAIKNKMFVIEKQIFFVSLLFFVVSFPF